MSESLITMNEPERKYSVYMSYYEGGCNFYYAETWAEACRRAREEFNVEGTARVVVTDEDENICWYVRRMDCSDRLAMVRCR